MFQLFRYVKLLILLTCENTTGITESNPWLALVTLQLSPRSKCGEIDPLTWLSSWSFILCVIMHWS